MFETLKILLEFIQGVTLPDGEVLVSFDMLFLFTNVPVDLPLRVAEQRLRQDDTLTDCTALEVEEVMQLLESCLNGIYFCLLWFSFSTDFSNRYGHPV